MAGINIEQKLTRGIGDVCDCVCLSSDYAWYIKCKQWCAKRLREIVEQLKNEVRRTSF